MQKKKIFSKNPNPSMKCYWSLTRTLLKVLCVPRIYDNNRYITDFKEKCQLFNSYISEQCTLLQNISTLPNTCSKCTNNLFCNLKRRYM